MNVTYNKIFGHITFFYIVFLYCISATAISEINPQKGIQNYNIVLIAVNVLRADHLSCYGYHRKTTPVIDELAEESFVFKNAFAQAGYTLPNMMSIITSLYPASHGVLDVHKDRLSTKIHTIAEILNIYGYKTVWLSELDEPHLSLEVGFERGYQHLYNLGREHNEIERLSSWITKNKNEKIFIAMNIRHLHSPYYPPDKYLKKFKSGEKGMISTTREEYYRSLYYKILHFINTPGSPLYNIFGEDIISLIIEKIRYYNNEKLFDKLSWERKVDKIRQVIPPEQRHKLGHIEGFAYKSQIDLSNKKNIAYLKSLYDACILGIDQEIIKPILAAIKKNKIYDNTLFVITADHGESLGEHKILFHGFHYYDEVIHVPMIIKLPRQTEPKEIRALAQSIDIMPTILSYLGIEIPAYAQGKSLLPLMKNKESHDIHKYISGENRQFAYLRSHRWKLIIEREKIHKDNYFRDKLYDLRADPAELNNLNLSHPDTYMKLRKILQERLDTTPKYIDKEYVFPPYIDKKTQKRIKETGYW